MFDSTLSLYPPIDVTDGNLRYLSWMPVEYTIPVCTICGVEDSMIHWVLN